MSLAEKIQQLRKQNNLSQEQLADQLGISRQSVSKWESELSTPEIDKIVQLSNIFGVTTDYLLKDIDQCLSKPVISSEPISLNDSKIKLRYIIGSLSLGFSMLSLFVLWVLSKIYPAPIVFFNTSTGRWLVGFKNFLWVHGLEGFYKLCWVIALVGAVLLFFDTLRVLWEKIATKISKSKRSSDNES